MVAHETEYARVASEVRFLEVRDTIARLGFARRAGGRKRLSRGVTACDTAPRAAAGDCDAVLLRARRRTASWADRGDLRWRTGGRVVSAWCSCRDWVQSTLEVGLRFAR